MTEAANANTNAEAAVSAANDNASTAAVTDNKVDANKTEKGSIEYKDFTLPEGWEIDKDAIGEFKSVAKELGLTQEQAQKLVDMQTKFSGKQNESLQSSWDKVQEHWRSEAEADKEFGGTNFQANVGVAKKALDKYGTPELREVIEVTGMGNNPELIRFLYRVGKTLGEDTVMKDGRAQDGAVKDHAKTLFPNMA